MKLKQVVAASLALCTLTGLTACGSTKPSDRTPSAPKSTPTSSVAEHANAPEAPKYVFMFIGDA